MDQMAPALLLAAGGSDSQETLTLPPGPAHPLWPASGGILSRATHAVPPEARRREAGCAGVILFATRERGSREERRVKTEKNQERERERDRREKTAEREDRGERREKRQERRERREERKMKREEREQRRHKR